ncbi:hypothetical protein O181_075053 [Austropuccinia psidii MF-1]|uniref:Uncharacterized protein n=1 Tax=Austropuccinia psidii MF-1 TaxID=1389203 RepID=A0A9Q3F840_9BASI|nr:hypothetical protein [Austropuccinia psidii MF-1]
MPNARSVYQSIKKRFNKASWSSIIHHANLLFNPTDQQSNLVRHAINLGEAVEAIESQIGPLDSAKMITLSLFFSIPKLRHQITLALDTRMAASPSLDINVEDILDIVQQITPLPPHPPHSASPLATRSAEWRRQWLTPQHPCFYCGEAGHWAPDCPARLKAAKARASTSSTQKQSNIASIGVVPLLENNEAFLDSGATHSVVGDISLFANVTPTDMKISVASSHQFNVDAIGNVPLNTAYGEILVKDVLYCKAIKRIVLSIGQLISQGTEHNYRWFLSVFPEPGLAGAGAVLELSAAPHVNYSTRPIYSKNEDLSMLWHRRLGHLSIRNIKQLLQFNAADGFDNLILNDIKICHPCSIAKAEHRPFSSPSRNHITAPGDLVAADLIGPLPLSIDGKKYALLIQDSYSRLTSVITLANKSEAKSQLRFWILRFVNSTNFKVKALRTDNGAEFRNKTLGDFLLEHGIIHEFSIPYKHHQNGKIERTNRTISKIARTSLIAAKLPTTLWPYAFKHAVWIFNRVLHADAQRTPYETVGGKKPSLVALRVFGAKSYLYDHLSQKDMSSKGIVGYHLGITPDSKGWLFWVPARRSVVRSASVKFNEDCFFTATANHSGVLSSIQIDNVFDNSMIKVLEQQDSFISAINSSHDIADVTRRDFNSAMLSSESNQWKDAVAEELKSMGDQDVFEICNLSQALKEVPHESILGTKWVFTKKRNPERFKGRLVARGFEQIHGINFEETFAPTPTFGALRMLFSIACLNKWSIRTFDVKVAFLHSLIDKPVYIWPPKGVVLPKNCVLKLKKALYGTKQAARCWWLHLRDRWGKAILWIHVDDGALTGSSVEVLDYISDELNKHFQIKWDTTVTGLVGLLIEQTLGGFKFSQTELIDKLINLTPSRITASLPLPPHCKLESAASTMLDKDYLKRIGILLYIAQGFRPDISYAVNYLARFSMGTDDSHWEALEHLIAYMRKTRTLGIQIGGADPCPILRTYVDANWGGEGDRSTHGFSMLHGNNPILWQSKRQATVATSTSQAEYIALSFSARECLWISNLYRRLLFDPTPILLSDNKTAIGIATDSMSRKKTRHLIREFNLINKYITKEKIRLKWVGTNEQMADILTKPIGHISVKKFVDTINFA